MAISFSENLRKAASATSAVKPSDDMIPVSLSLDSGNTKSSEEIFTKSGKYLWYDEYKDENYSTVDELKNITVDSKQINLTQESNSQFIPFQMNRYYDGVDLMEKSLQIVFENKEGSGNIEVPVNVQYSNSKIRFGWLVSKSVTAIAGDVTFEIRAIGVTSKNDEYIFKTRPNGKLNILKSLAGNGIIEPSTDWITSLTTQINEKIAAAQTAAHEAQTAAANAEASAQMALQAAADSQISIDEVKTELSASVDSAVTEKITTALSGYYTSEQVDTIVANIDISDQLDEVKNQIDSLDGLADFNVEYDGRTMTFYNGESVMKGIEINSDPSAEWTNAYTAGVEEKITAAKTEIQGNLDTYKEITDADLAGIHSEIDGLPQTLEADYYTKGAADELLEAKADQSAINALNTAVSAVESTANTNKSNITVLGSKISDLETTIGEIDISPKVTYEATYDEEQIYTLWEIEGEGDSEVRTPKGQFKISGGSGGGSTSSVLKIEYITKTPLIITVHDKAVIKYNFSGTDSSGDDVLQGTATWRIGNTVIASHTVVSGENSFDVTDYLSLGSQKIMLSITDDAGSLFTKSWTVQKIDVRLESAFNDSLTYPLGTVSFDYTPYGAVSKDVHFLLDGVELPSVTTASSGIPMAYNLPSQPHGSHLLEVYMTAEMNGSVIESNHITKDIIWYDAASDIPVISCMQQDITARQYDTTNLVYSVYDPKTENPRVTLAVDGETVSTLVLDGNTQIWQYKSADVGVHTLTITCRNTVKTLVVTIEKLDIDIKPVTAGLAFDFNPSGRSNNDTDRLWSDGDVSMTVSDNFDWVNGGYQIDENGDQYFCIKAGTSADINYQLFADDAKRNGKEFKLVFKTTNVQTADARFLSCVDNTTGSDHIGIEMFVHEAYIYGSANKLHLPYSENDKIEFEFNINNNQADIPMVRGYEDGVPTRPMVYDDSYNFTQNTPKNISLGSPNCDLYIYRLKVYNTALTSKGILNNFIADAGNAEEMIARYNRNQIYDENGQLTKEHLAEVCPWLRVIAIEAPYFTNNKSDKVKDTTIHWTYKDGDPVLDNWTAYHCMHSGQGTSSNNYGGAGRNMDLIMNKSGYDGVEPYIMLGDGTTKVSKVSLTRNSVDVNYLNVKVNIASSENMNNAELQRRYNQFNPYKRPFIRDNPDEISKIKDTMEFYNCVVFIKESDPDLSTHREFADHEWHFYAIGNVGDSKKTDQTRLTDPADKYECILEIMDNDKKNSTFPGDEQGLTDLEADSFDENNTYGWRYIWENGTEQENAEVIETCKTAWKNFYQFVVTSTDEEFHANLKDYFVVDSALFYYLFTTRYTMIDNRAKNTFWHYGKTGGTDAEGNPIRKWDLCFDYDNDTALGINNFGEMVFRYGYEDTDYVDGTTDYVFNAASSTFFCRLRDIFADELKTMYTTLESSNCWSASSLIHQFDESQAQFPEALWIEDIIRKYDRTYNSTHINGAGNPQFLVEMANGRKKYQRRQFERNQEAYMASKYWGTAASSNNIVFRCAVPQGDLSVAPNYRLQLTPYSYMYLNVKYGTSSPLSVRAVPGVTYEIPYDGTVADIVDIYSAPNIQSVGDLSPCYILSGDFSKASKLKELILGSSTAGYNNPGFTTLGLGANSLLETLNIENVSGLTQSLNMSSLNNLKELYAHGSNIGGVTFASGGNIRIAELPAVGAITARNLSCLTDLDIESYDKLTILNVENCSTIDVVNIFELASNINRVRITGIDWVLTDASLLNRIYAMSGIDKNGYNISQSVLAGKVHVPVMREQQLSDYHTAWPDLEITYDTLINQFAVTFVNDDGTVLDIQYVDKGEKPVDPVTRADHPINTPTKESTVSTDFTFAGWDTNFVSVFANQTITAAYTESLRKYTVKYVSKGTVLQESVGEYGSTIFYHGDIPVYTAEESAYKYYLFYGWDQSGYINGPKTINAVYDTCEYNLGYFDGKDLSTLRPVEIYVMLKLGIEAEHVELKDSITFELGHDYSFEDIEEQVLINEKTEFTGSNYVDTGVSIFDEDRDFVLAVDYKFVADNTTNSTLAQCYQANGANGFRLWYNNEPKLAWGTSSLSPSAVNKREMLVIRHIKGEHGLHVYISNLAEIEVSYSELAKTKATSTDASLVFGCAKADDGVYENYARGTVYWSKIWYADLGDEACRNLAAWTHETRTLEMCGFKRYYFSDNSSRRCSMTFLDSHLLSRDMILNDSSTNAGGWASCKLNSYLNTRLYKAIPVQWRQLLKQVQISSSVGNKSTELSTSDCYITIPAVIEAEPSMTSEPYVYEGSSIPYLTTNQSRICTYDDGTAGSYWLRSPNVSYSSYYYRVDDGGGLYGYYYAYHEGGIRIMFSI